MNTNVYIPYDLLKLTNHSAELTIPDGYFNGKSIITFNISNNGELKRIEIGNDSYGDVREFDLEGLSELESVVIGQRSFTYSKEGNDVWKSKRSVGDYRIVNCLKLKYLQIGDYSFSDYHSFELNNLPSLQSIDIGKYCFYHAASFSLTGLMYELD